MEIHRKYAIKEQVKSLGRERETNRKTRKGGILKRKGGRNEENGKRGEGKDRGEDGEKIPSKGRVTS